jgi:plasmid stabilization system protein ParE
MVPGTQSPQCRRIRGEIAKAIKMIADNPAWYPPGDTGTRRFILLKFPFSVVYRVGPSILIVAVAHHKRRPGYWMNRAQPSDL